MVYIMGVALSDTYPAKVGIRPIDDVLSDANHLTFS